MEYNSGVNSSTANGGVSTNESGDSKASPIIISQSIRFTGNSLVHLQPQIIHVQQQHQQQYQPYYDNMGRRNLTLSNSLPPGLPNYSPMKGSMRTTYVGSGARVETAQYDGPPRQQEHQVPSGTTSRNSPGEMSPGGCGDSPQSNSFTSAQSELDDVIIGEILSMEEEQHKRNSQGATSKASGSLTYADTLESLLSSGRRMSYSRQVSNSAPTSTIDIEGMVREEMMQEQELVRDRRKKDIHNMIERRRRYNINDRIKELGTMLPKTYTEDLKLNKGTILKASVEYIRVLLRDQQRTHQVLQRYHGIEQDNKIMAMRIQELEQRLEQHGIPVSPSPAGLNGRGRLERPIKAEPVDEDQTPQPRPDHPAPSFQCFPQGHNIPQQQHMQQVRPILQHSNGLVDYNGPLMAGHTYAISTDAQYSNVYSSTACMTGDGGVLETPPVVSNHLSLFGERRPPAAVPAQLGMVNQHVSELMMDLGERVNGTGVSTASAVAPSTVALMSMADPLMSDSQVASPDVQWDSQAFSPETERMDFVAH